MWTERNERTSYSRCTWRTSSSSSLSSTSSSTTACSPTVTCLFSTCSTRLSCDHNHFIALVWWIVQQEQVTVQRVILTLSDVQRRGFCIVTGGEDKLLWLWPRYQNSGGRKYDEVTLRRADIAFFCGRAQWWIWLGLTDCRWDNHHHFHHHYIIIISNRYFFCFLAHMGQFLQGGKNGRLMSFFF